MSRYVGIRVEETGHIVVCKDGEPLDPAPSQKLYNHSPDGFAWGYAGSGSAQLALALLLDVTGKERVSLLLHQYFKAEHVATWDAVWIIETDQVKQWSYNTLRRLQKTGMIFQDKRP